MKKLNKNSFTFRMPNSMRENLESVAMENEASSSEVVRYAISQFLENDEEQNTKGEPFQRMASRFSSSNEALDKED